MNGLEKLMIAESKKNAIDDELIKDEQLCKYAESETDCILFAQVHIIANI